MKQIYTIFMAVILLSVSACNAQSINTTTVENLDLKRYMGRWYELARYDHRFERDMERCEAFYTIEPNGKIAVRNSGVDSKTGLLRITDGKAKLGKHPGQLRVSFFLFFYSDYNIMALGENYDWALVGSSSPKYLWILSRTPSLPEETLEHILTEAQARGYDTDRLIWVRQ
jgi:lipocalin